MWFTRLTVSFTVILMLALTVMVESIHGATPEDCANLKCNAPGDPACLPECECVFMGNGYGCVPVVNWRSRMKHPRFRLPLQRRRQRPLWLGYLKYLKSQSVSPWSRLCWFTL
ncbi:uncharacterized protein LOC119407068 isoform X2 [Rhipicephalus sanguineus]|uniref:uncharacterized protein LOC119407068 isoform X2 n=1 Tax=Rhipicephalus sanguineus TaxID=34632 RepID=UPI001895FD11|nr:uncharacterized protein LOC119407068 isoform X2 [Rhipicephalus sanguineus]